MKLKQAQQIAESLKDDLEPYCERIEIGGSIRRKKPDVKDIELVCIPKFEDVATGQRSLGGDLITEKTNQLLEHLANQYYVLKMGERYAQIQLGENVIKADIFAATPVTWGYIFMIRTGPAEFSKWVVTELKRKEYVPNDGALWVEHPTGLTMCSTFDEAEVFRYLGIDWIEPEYRHNTMFWK